MHDVATARKSEPNARLVKLQAELVTLRGAYARLQHLYTRALEDLELARRRMFVAKSERVDTNADQLAFDKMFDQVEGLRQALGAIDAANGEKPKGDRRKNRRGKSTGRRDLAKMPLPVQRVEIVDPELEGRVKRIGVEESQRVVFRRGGRVRLVIARVVYKQREVATCQPAPTASLPRSIVAGSAAKEVCVRMPDLKPTGFVVPGGHCGTSPSVCAPAVARQSPAFRIVKAPMPKELFPGGLLAPSMIAHILFDKYVMGVPFYRQEQQSAAEGFRIGRATMCRYAEDAGATLGAIVEAARKEALATAFCLSTDATGISIQPTPLEDGKERKRQPCRKGHFFVALADRDHVFFDFQTKHNSAAVWEMFKGFSGYVQADAHTIYDALFRGSPPKDVTDDVETRAPPPKEVGCWSHYPEPIVIRSVPSAGG